MNVEDYKTKLPYYTQADFKRHVYYDKDSKQEIYASNVEHFNFRNDSSKVYVEKRLDNDAWNEYYQAYQNDCERLKNQFKDDLIVFNNLPLDKFSYALYDYIVFHIKDLNQIKLAFERIVPIYHTAKDFFTVL